MLLSNTNSSILCDWAKNASFQIEADAFAFDIKGLVLAVEGLYLVPVNNTDDVMIQLALQEVFVSSTGYSTLIFISTSETGTMNAFNFVDYMRKKISKIDDQDGNYTIALCGYDAMLYDVQEGYLIVF